MGIIKEGVAKDGTKFVIRTPEMGDVESVWKYINRLSKEKTFVSFQGEEVSLKQEEEFVTNVLKEKVEKKGVTLFLVVEGEVQGISHVSLHSKTKSHVGTFGLSIDASVRGKGLGETLMRTVLDAATTLPGIRIVTLTVVAQNQIARALYTKLGFKEYGRLPLGTTNQGVHVDEVMMYRNV